MPPITYMQLVKKRQEGKDLYSRKNGEAKGPLAKAEQKTLQGMYNALNRTIKNIENGKNRIDTKPLRKFRDNLDHLFRDPAEKEQYTDKEKQDRLWHPEKPQRPLGYVNRNTIEDAVCELSGLGDYLGKEVPREFTNTYDYILQQAEPGDDDIIRDGLELLNDTLELGLPMEQLQNGETVSSTREQREEWKQYKKNIQEGQENRKENLENWEKAVQRQEQERQRKLREAEELERREIEEKTKRQLEEEERKKREAEEARKSAEEKARAEAARAEKARLKEQRNQGAMRLGISESIKQYRRGDLPMESRKMNMAMAAAFQAELNRVGLTGNIPIDQDRVRKDIESNFHSAEFTIAEANGTLEELTKLEPSEIATRITRREQEVQRIHPEGADKSWIRAEKLYQQFNDTWRVKSNSDEFVKAKAAMLRMSEKKSPATRGEQYLAAETVKAYVAKNINWAKSSTGQTRMAISLAFLKQTMTKGSFEAYCRNLNGLRGIGLNDVTNKRFIDPRTIGTVDEVYAEARERIRTTPENAKPDPRDLAMLTALSKIKERGGGNKVVEQDALQTEIEKVQADKRFQDSMAKDSREDLVNKAFYGQLNKVEGYAAPAKVPEIHQQQGPQL